MVDKDKKKQLHDLLDALGCLDPKMKGRSNALAKAFDIDGLEGSGYLWNDYFEVEVPRTLDDAILVLKAMVYPLARAEFQKQQA